MALNARDFTLPGQWAKEAETIIPPIPISGQAYRNAAIIKSLIELGQQYDNVADSAIWNQILYLVSGIAKDSETYGIPRWSPMTDYAGDASLCIGIDGVPYRATQDSGPGVAAGPQDPTTTTGYWQTLAEYISGGSGGGGRLGQPIGTVFWFAGTTAPENSLVCDGTAISRVGYSDLFAVIGAIYGSGDGSTTFNLPDLRGEFIRGWDDGRGVDSGRAFGSRQKGSLIAYDPLSTLSQGEQATAAYQGSIDAITLSNTMGTDIPNASDYPGAQYIDTNDSVWPSHAINTAIMGVARPRNVALLPCIQCK